MSEELLDAQVDRLLGPHVPPVQAIARTLRGVIRAEFPGVDEKVDFGNKLIGYGRSMKVRDLLFAVMPHAAHVNLQLADGATLPDPTGIVEGTGKRIRHVKVRSVDAARSEAVRELIRAQLATRP
jgi:hypothetical protein